MGKTPGQVRQEFHEIRPMTEEEGGYFGIALVL